MSTAAAETVENNDGDTPAPPNSGRKKKLIIIVVAVALVVLASAGGGAALYLKKKRVAAEAAAAAAAGADGEAAPVAQAAPAHRDTHKGPPTFLPLDPFIVNLADRETERFAQIGITLELNDPKFGDQIKAYMPAIRNGILMVLAHKDSKVLLTRAGKERLAAEVMREAVRPLGIDLEDDGEEAPKEGAKDEDKGTKTPLEESPVRHVHFSSFIIQ